MMSYHTLTDDHFHQPLQASSFSQVPRPLAKNTKVKIKKFLCLANNALFLDDKNQLRNSIYNQKLLRN